MAAIDTLITTIIGVIIGYGYFYIKRRLSLQYLQIEAQSIYGRMEAAIDKDCLETFKKILNGGKYKYYNTRAIIDIVEEVYVNHIATAPEILKYCADNNLINLKLKTIYGRKLEIYLKENEIQL